MKVILNLPCELEEVQKKLFLLAQSDWHSLSRKVSEEFYDKDGELSAPELFKLIGMIRGSLVELDTKLDQYVELLKEQQATLLGIGASEAAETPAPISIDTKSFRKTFIVIGRKPKV